MSTKYTRSSLFSYPWILAAVFWLVLLVMAFTFHWSYRKLQEQFILNFQVRQGQYTRLVAESTVSQLSHLFEVLDSLADYPGVSSLDPAGIELLEQTYIQESDSIKALTRITPEMVIEYTLPNTGSIGADLSGQTHNLAMVRDQNRLVSAPFDAVQGYKAISLAEPVFHDSNFAGSIAMLVDFTGLINSPANRHGDSNGSSVWLVDQSGIILQTPYHDQIGRNIRQLFPDRHELTAVIDNPASDNGMLTTSGGLAPAAAADQAMIGSYSRIQLTGSDCWFVFDLHPLRDVLAGFPAARLPFMVSLMFIVAIVIGFVIVIRMLARYKDNLEIEVKNRTLELEASRSKYIQLIGSMNEGVAASDEHGIFTVVNPALERILGVDPGELTGKETSSFLAPGQLPVLLYHHRLRQEGKSSSYEIRVNTARGAQRTLQVSGSPNFNKLGEYCGATSFIQDVTTQRAAESSLSQERRMFLDGPVVVFRLRHGSGFPVDYVSPNVFQFGYAAAEIADSVLKYIDLVHPDDRSRVEREFEKNSRGGAQAFELEFRLVRGDGSSSWVNVFISILRNDEGEITHYIGYLIDITERKRIGRTQQVLINISDAHSKSASLEEFVAEIREHLGNLIDTRNFYIALYDNQSGFYSFPYFVDEMDQDFSPQSLKDSLTDFVRRTGKPLFSNTEIHLQLERAGEIRTVGPMSPVWLGAPLKTNSGTIGVVAVQSYTSELTYDPEDLDLLAYVSDHIAIAIERKQAETALRKSEETHRRLVEVAQESIITVDENDVITFANDMYCRTIGFDRSDLIGRCILDMVDEQSRARIIEGTQLRKQDETSSYEIRHEANGGQYRDFLVSSAPLINDNGEYEGAIGVLVDITDRKRSQEALQHTQKLESLGVLAGGIAHDFNNLLVGIIGNAELAFKDAGTNANLRDYLQDIEIAAHRAAELTRQMLAYSGRGKFVVEPVDLRDIAKEMGHLLEAAISKSVSISYRFDPATPLISADVAQIRQVVMNLILNAAEAIGERPGSVNVTVGSVEVDADYFSDDFLMTGLPGGRYVSLDVNDNGCGMDEETQSKMFDPFFTTKFTGRGLGLAAVLGIVRGHNGALRVDSQPGKGSNFRALFPSLEGHIVADQNSEPESEEVVLAGKILLVDDEPTIRKVGQRILSRAGFDVVCANDGMEGIELFKASPEEFDVIILDITMPRMGGDEAFREIISINPMAKVLLTSGYDEEDVTVRFAGRKLAGFIQKPFSSNSLVEKIRSIINSNP